MKTKATRFKVLIFAIALTLLGKVGSAQTFDYYVLNDHLVSPTVFEFDVMIKNTSGSDFSLRTAQHCFTFNPAFINGAVQAGGAAYVAGSTQMVNYVPGSISWNSSVNGFQVATNGGVACNNGTIILGSGVPLRVATFRLTATTGIFGCAASNTNMVKAGDSNAPPVAQLALRMSLTKWNDATCFIGTNATMTQGTFTNFLSNTLIAQMNNMAPGISLQPTAQGACAGSGSATFTSNSNGNGLPNPITYQWFENGSPLSETPPYSGTNTNTLHISNPTAGMSGNTYYVVATQCTLSSTSSTALLTLINPDDGNACTTDACDPATGQVTHTPINTDDGNPCTTDGCNPVDGVFHNPVATDDGNPCTTDACDVTTGAITHTPVATTDNDLCTTDACDPATGQISHTPVNTNDNNVCTTDGCDPITGISHTPVNTNDNNACTTDGCDPITGPSHTPVNTNDNNACTDDGCDPATGPTHTPVNINDNNECTIDACAPATGVSHTPVNTNDNNACTTDGCDPATGAISHLPVTTTDGNACTVDACDPTTGAITHTAVNTNDNNACTTDGCDPSTGVFHNPVNTDDNNVCTTDGCNPSTGPTHTPVNTNDNNACTTDACDPITGPSHTPVNTNDNNVCTTDACDPVTGPSHTPVNTNDNNACTTDACDPITGPSHTPINTNDNNACTTDGCDPATGPFHTPVNTNDNNACTVDACNTSTGAITHTPVNTNDNNPCTTDGCDPATGAITHTPVPVDDGNPCTNDACTPANGITHTPVNTNDNNACTEDACDPITGAVTHTAVVTTDNDPCTDDACNPANGQVTHTNNFHPTASSTPASCSGNDGTATSSAGSAYLWSTGGTTQTITQLGAGTYTVTVTSALGCTGTATTTVTSNGTGGQAPGPISGPFGVCRGQTGVVYCVAAVPGATSYQWTLPSGAIGTSTGPCITLRFNSHFSGGQLCVKSVSPCGTSTPTCLTLIRITAKPPTPGTITGPSPLCPGQTGTYCIPAIANATSYNWTVTGGLIIQSGQGTPCIVVLAPAGFTAGTVNVTASNCKGTSAKKTKNLTGVPPMPVWYNKNKGDNDVINVCGGSTHEYEIHLIPGVNCYVWTAPPGAIINDRAGHTGNPLTVTGSVDDVDITFPPGFTSGTVTVSACGPCGSSAVATLFIQAGPAAPVWDYDVPGENPTFGVCGGTTRQYEVHFQSSVTCYTWSAPPGAVINTHPVSNVHGNPITFQGNHDDVNITFPPGFVSGFVTVSACNSCGTSQSITLFVQAAPQQPGPISGSSAVCRTQTNVQYSVPSNPSTNSYTWSVTGGAQITQGQGTRNIRVGFTNSNSSPVTLSVVANGTCGVSTPATKTINVNMNCKTGNDGEEAILDPSIESLMAYPNPTSGKVTVAFNASMAAKYSVKVVDLIGHVMINENISAVEGYNTKEINLESVAKGIYLISVESEGAKAETLRLIVD